MTVGDPYPLEIDHVFVWVEPHAPEAAALVAAGFRLDGETAEHPNQGTASCFFSFENAYLEMTWVEDESAAPPDLIVRSRWRETGASPLGIGLRRRVRGAAVPFATRVQTANWMPTGAAIEIAVASQDPAEPYLFVVPPEMAVPPPHEMASDERVASEHPCGARRLTHVGIRGHASEMLRPLAAGGVLGWEAGARPFMDLVLDGGRTGRSLDLGDLLPLCVQW